MIISKAASTKTERRVLCAVLACMLLLGGLPLTVGIIPVQRSEGPSWTLNICHPLQSFVEASGTPVARPATALLRVAMAPQGYAPELVVHKFPNLAIAPDSPPPKALI
jgi:hypothetical protein